jgi:hypothetical protein
MKYYVKRNFILLKSVQSIMKNALFIEGKLAKYLLSNQFNNKTKRKFIILKLNSLFLVLFIFFLMFSLSNSFHYNVSYNIVMIQKPAIQLQENSYDCGLFALANATTLCNGFDPVNVIYNPKK